MIVRMRYRKTELGRYLSHLDLIRTMERTFRRAGVALSFSEGYNPHPKFSFASALAVGITSDGEYLDAELREFVDPNDIERRISEAAPLALEIAGLKEIMKPKYSLSAVINRSLYRVYLTYEDPAEIDRIKEALDKILLDSELWIQEPKQKQIRHMIHKLESDVDNGVFYIEMLLETGQSGNIKPQDILKIINARLAKSINRPWIFHRNGLYIQTKEGLFTPMDVEGEKGDSEVCT